jgi:hypothetical protein
MNNNITIEELVDNNLTAGAEIESVFKKNENIDDDDDYDCGYHNHYNRYVNPLYRHCDLGGE